MSQWRILLVDDHQVVRAGLRTMLNSEAGCEVVGEAATGEEGVSLAERLQPDVIITDMVMRGLSGLEVVRQARQVAAASRIIIFSVHADETYLREALRAGASAYVLKESPASELLVALGQVMAGRRYVSAELSECIISSYAQVGASTSADPYAMLTEREREVLALAAAGLTSTQIAERLVISVRTVDSHRTNMMRKLGLHTVADLVRYAIRRGVIALDH